MPWGWHRVECFIGRKPVQMAKKTKTIHQVIISSRAKGTQRVVLVATLVVTTSY